MFSAPIPGSTVQPGLLPGMNSAAAYGGPKFRYALAYCWNENLPLWLWVMLNPSTATEEATDPTTDQCLCFTMRLSKQEEREAGGLAIVNLFAYRATDKKELLPPNPDPIGPENDEWIQQILGSGRISKIIVAWGNPPKRRSFAPTYRGRVGDVLRLLREASPDICQLGESSTRKGAPPHPLPLPGNTPLRPYKGEN